MYRYTTPYHQFKLPLLVSGVEKLYITYAQYNKVLFEKTLEDCTIIDNTTIKVHLSQEDTAKFREDGPNTKPPEVQITILTTDNERLTSKIITLTAGKVFKEEVI